MIIISMIAMVLVAQPTETVRLEQRDNDAVAVCQMRLDPKGEKPEGDNLLLGWQFDTAKAGQIARDSVRIHDPNGLLAGRTFESVKVEGKNLVFFATDPATGDRASAALLGLSPFVAEDPSIYAAVISIAEAGDLRPRYSGTCLIRAYEQGSNLMFDALVSRPAKEPSK